MDAETTRWVAGVAISVMLGLVGLVWGLVKARQDKAEERQERADARLASHVTDDIAVHERVVRLETEVSTLKVDVGPMKTDVPILKSEVAMLKTEVKAIREMRHDIIEHTGEALASWYANVVEMVGKRFADLVALIERVKK